MAFRLTNHAREEMLRRNIPPATLQDRQVLEMTTMKVTYDPETDILRVLFSSAAIQESDEDKPGVVLDYDQDGNIVGLEIMDASKRTDNPRVMEYAIAE